MNRPFQGFKDFKELAAALDETPIGAIAYNYILLALSLGYLLMC